MAAESFADPQCRSGHRRVASPGRTVTSLALLLADLLRCPDLRTSSARLPPSNRTGRLLPQGSGVCIDEGQTQGEPSQFPGNGGRRDRRGRGRRRVPHPAIGSVKGANERINVAILGPGGRAQEHIRILKHLKDETKAVDIIGLCDVWDGNDADQARGLYYSAKKCGLDAQGKDKDRITKDYRRLLECKDIDAVLIATPDHWHAKMSIDAMEAGKDVYCEKPMTHTIDEARKVAETVKKTKQVFTVGVQSTADPRWKMANQMITEGKIGHVMQGQTSYYRNSNDGPVAVLRA